MTFYFYIIANICSIFYNEYVRIIGSNLFGPTRSDKQSKNNKTTIEKKGA